MPYFVYILECADKSLYVGCTNDIEKRIKQHNESKRGAHYTKIRRPVKLVYSEKFAILKKARRRERVIKGWKRAKKLNLINLSVTRSRSRSEAEGLKDGAEKKAGLDQFK